jgi:hypothetical protein
MGEHGQAEAGGGEGAGGWAARLQELLVVAVTVLLLVAGLALQTGLSRLTEPEALLRESALTATRTGARWALGLAAQLPQALVSREAPGAQGPADRVPGDAGDEPGLASAGREAREAPATGLAWVAPACPASLLARGAAVAARARTLAGMREGHAALLAPLSGAARRRGGACLSAVRALEWSRRLAAGRTAEGPAGGARHAATRPTGPASSAPSAPTAPTAASAAP